MSTPILTTKLYIPPPQPKVVLRPRLIERLNEGLHRRLTLVSGPAGFGKTTLLSEWLAGRSQPAAWLSLDEGDNDPTRFLAYLVAASYVCTQRSGSYGQVTAKIAHLGDALLFGSRHHVQDGKAHARRSLGGRKEDATATQTSGGALDFETLRRAIEGRDAEALLGFYAEDAEMLTVNRNTTPSSPHVLRGKEQISEYLRDVCSREMTHRVENEVVGENRIAFQEACEYPDGVRVLGAETLELRDGKIVRQVNVEAWDE